MHGRGGVEEVRDEAANLAERLDSSVARADSLSAGADRHGEREEDEAERDEQNGRGGM